MISIHAPHAGRDVNKQNVIYDKIVFQSTRPMRGATERFAVMSYYPFGISIHAPHAGRDQL